MAPPIVKIQLQDQERLAVLLGGVLGGLVDAVVERVLASSTESFENATSR